MWISLREMDRRNACFMAAYKSNQPNQALGLNKATTTERLPMEDKRVFLVGCILQGMAQSRVYFGMAEDALAIADAVLLQMAESEVGTTGHAVHERQAGYIVS